MKNEVKQIMIAIMAAVISLPAMAQMSTNEQQWGSTPTATFQSTSAMQSSGSAYSSPPIINSDGTATPNDTDDSGSSSGHPGKPKTVAPPVPEGDPTPIGDGMWVLAILAAAYAAYIARQKVRAVRVREEA